MFDSFARYFRTYCIACTVVQEQWLSIILVKSQLLKGYGCAATNAIAVAFATSSMTILELNFSVQ